MDALTTNTAQPTGIRIHVTVVFVAPQVGTIPRIAVTGLATAPAAASAANVVVKIPVGAAVTLEQALKEFGAVPETVHPTFQIENNMLKQYRQTG